MADYDKAIALLAEIKQSVAQLHQARIDPRRIVIAEGLSDIDLGLGLVKAGEFRAGNEVDPGHGFSGVRIAYPGMTYDSEEWNIVGVDNDVMTFGVRASDGVAVAGAGAVTLDNVGVTLEQGTSGVNMIKWATSAGERVTSVYAQQAGTIDILTLAVPQAAQASGITGSQIQLRAHTDLVNSQSNNVVLYVNTGTTANPDILTLDHSRDGSTTEYFRVSLVGGFIWNEDAQGLPFRIEGDDADRLFEVDTNNNYVAIGSTLGTGTNVGDIAHFASSSIQFNKATQDIDFEVDGASVTGILKVDAGLDVVLLNSRKTDTGDHTGQEGMLVINTFDNNIKMYADGAWRTLASW